MTVNETFVDAGGKPGVVRVPARRLGPVKQYPCMLSVFPAPACTQGRLFTGRIQLLGGEQRREALRLRGENEEVAVFARIF